MKLTRDARGEGPLISGIIRGGFRVDDGVYPSLIITPERVESWTPPPIEVLDEQALAPLLALNPAPEFLLLGTGSQLLRPSQSFVAALEARNIGVELMDSRTAARAWSVLRSELRWIAGALYPLD